MGSSNWSEVAVTLGIDLTIAIASVLGFYFLIVPYLLQSDRGAIIRKALRSWSFDPAQMSEDVQPQQRLAAQLYIEVLHLLLLVALMMLFGTCLLTPINWYQGTNYTSEDDFFKKLSSLNIDDGEDIFWVHATYTWLFSFAVVFLVLRSRNRIKQYDSKYDFKAAEFALALRGLPEHLIDSAKIKDAIAVKYPEVRAVQIAFNLEELLGLMAQLQRVTRITELCHTAQKMGFQPRVCCCKVDLTSKLELLADRQAALEREIQDQRSTGLRGTGWAFITFNTHSEAVRALAYGEMNGCLEGLLEKGTVGRALEVGLGASSPAAEPELVSWNNLQISAVRRLCHNCCISVILFLVVVLLFSGSALFDILDSLTEALPPWFAATVSNYLPSLVTFLCAWVFVPLIIELTADSTPFHRYDDYAKWYLRRYFAYLVVAVVFVTTTTLSLSALVKSWVNNESTKSAFTSVFGGDFTVYYIKYAINFALLSSPLELLQFPELLLSQLESCTAFFCRKLCKGVAGKYAKDVIGVGIPSVALFEYPRQYVVVLHVLTIGILYCTIAPILTPFVLLFLVVKRKIDCTNLLLQRSIPVESQSGLFTGTADVAIQPLNLVMVSLGLYQIIMTLFFAARERNDLAIGTAVVLSFSTGLYFLALIFTKLPYKKLSKLASAVSAAGDKVGGVLGDTTLGLSLRSLEHGEVIEPPGEAEYEHPALQVYLGERTFSEVVLEQQQRRETVLDMDRPEGDVVYPDDGRAKPVGRAGWFLDSAEAEGAGKLKESSSSYTEMEDNEDPTIHLNDSLHVASV